MRHITMDLSERWYCCAIMLFFLTSCSSVSESSKSRALREAKKAFIQEFGVKHANEYEPLVAREVWHVYGSSPYPMGGEPNAVVDKERGVLLNVWHTK